ncbi:MAG: hypothetical protein Q9227_007491 [Pyrenula ochraceoflavens]
MIADDLYELCLPLLDDKELEEEDKPEKLQELLSKEKSLSGKPLENAVLDALWRHRNSSTKGGQVSQRLPAARAARPIPRAPTPLGSPSPLTGTSPANPPPGFPISRPSFSRQRSTAPSPFASPRPSPSLAFAQPIPHSPSLNAYEFSRESSPAPDIYGDYGSDTVEWLVSDDAPSVATSIGSGQLSAAAPEWVPQPDMEPYDILRSVLGGRKNNDEIKEALEQHSYDLEATIAALSEADPTDQSMLSSTILNDPTSVLVGKSMNMDQSRPMTPNNGQSPIVCRYWLKTGSCYRGDCRYAHDLTNHLCKYWMNGACLAGAGCPFSHDPSALMSGMSSLSVTDSSSMPGTPPQFFQVPDNSYDQFPSLSGQRQNAPSFNMHPGAGTSRMRNSSRTRSRPSSRQQHQPELSSAPSVDDPEAFPTLSAVNAKGGKKHHGKRGGHGHNPNAKENSAPNSLAEVVRMSGSPGPAQRRNDVLKRIKSSGPESAAAQKILAPQHIPWLETGERANTQYLKYRQEAIKHGSVRNKFLQSAAQAWNRNDARAAKALSLRGQAENEAMRKAHREAAKHLYEARNQHLSITPANDDADNELYIDLHGLHPEEAVEYLEGVLVSHARLGRQVIYAITGTGHHSKNGKDKVGKAVRGWLNEWRYVYREFSVPGERGGYVGGILGIDPTSHANGPSLTETAPKQDAPVSIQGGKIQLLKREER